MAERPAIVSGITRSRQGAEASSSMRAVVQDGYGGSDVLRLAQVPRPPIRPREVLVHVRAAGLDRGTWHLMQGKPRLAAD